MSSCLSCLSSKPKSKQEYEAIIIRKTSNTKPFDNTKLKPAKQLGHTQNEKFHRFRTWLADHSVNQSVRLHAIAQFEGLGKCWARLEVSSRVDAIRLHQELSKRASIGMYRKELSLCYLLERPVFIDSPRNERFPATVNADKFTGGSLCGQLAEFQSDSTESIITTIGGILKDDKDGRLWAVTAKHRPEAPLRQTNSTRIFNEEDYEIDDLRRPWIIEARPRERAAPKEKPKQPIRLQSAGEIGTKLECSLIPLDGVNLMVPNQFRPNSNETHRALSGIIEEKPRAGMVAVLTGTRGCQFMTMLPVEVKLHLPSGEWVTVWTLEPEKRGEGSSGFFGMFATEAPIGLVTVGPGDSGSWVVDPDRGSVFGVVIASTGHNVYLVPLKDVVEAAGKNDGTRTWELPKFEDIVAARRSQENPVAESVPGSKVPVNFEWALIMQGQGNLNIYLEDLFGTGTSETRASPASILYDPNRPRNRTRHTFLQAGPSRNKERIF